MEIEVWSVGKTKFTADPEFQEPMIREVIDQRGDVASTVLEYTDSQRSDISHDQYARVTGDVPGLVLFEGWLTGDRAAPPPAHIPGAVLVMRGVIALREAEVERLRTAAIVEATAIERLGIDRARAMTALRQIISSGDPIEIDDIANAALDAMSENLGGTRSVPAGGKAVELP